MTEITCDKCGVKVIIHNDNIKLLDIMHFDEKGGGHAVDIEWEGLAPNTEYSLSLTEQHIPSGLKE